MHHHDLLIFLAAGLAIAAVLGLITQWVRLSPIVGYLLAGIIVGPAVLGLVEDEEVAMQLGEIGVVLLMFGVGLHFNLRELWSVRHIALPGAIGQIVVATLLGTLATYFLGWSLPQGLVVGLAISIASTVVLVRVLMDNRELETPQGHIAVGWLIVQDIFTVVVLVMLPALAGALKGSGAAEGDQSLWQSLGMALFNIVLLVLIILGGGRRVIPWLLTQVARTRSRELFTLSILAVALAIATGSAEFFGVSMALGAFLAGMVVGQSEMSHQAAADALPLRDAFAVLFFMYVGMELKPQVILDEPLLMGSILGIILIANPLTAFLIVWTLRYSLHTALTVAFALAQIGEFSFLLAEEAIRHDLLSESGRSALVACAIITITINPVMFRAVGPFERWLRRHPRLWRLASQRSEEGGRELNRHAVGQIGGQAGPVDEPAARAVIIGFGPVGKIAARILRDFDIEPVVVDLNLDTVRQLMANNQLAVYGDATRRDILEAAGIVKAKYLLVTTPEVLVRTLVVITAKEINPDLHVFVRARYLSERQWLDEVGATQVCIEEAETALGLAMLLLREVGADEGQIGVEIERIHSELGINRSKIGSETEFDPIPG